MNRWVITSVSVPNYESDVENLTLRLADDWNKYCSLTAPMGTYTVGTEVVITVYPVDQVAP